MKIVVNDAGIIIDLLKIDLMGDFFRLPYEFHTSDLVRGEITDINRPVFKKFIDAKQIHIHDFQSGELTILHRMNNEKKTLSIHGIIWILEGLINDEIILPPVGAMKLEDLLDISPRLKSL